MNFKHIYVIILLAFILGCKQETYQLSKIEGSKIEINDTLDGDSQIESFIKPYREHVNKDVDSALAYSVGSYDKEDNELNTAIGNLIADIVMSEANPVFKKRTGNNIDLVVLNHGGIRSHISKGNITARTAYRIMPFENLIVVVGLKGERINEIISFLIKINQATPISGLKILLDKDYKLLNATINGEEIDPEKTYYVATSDFLYNYGDNMSFFQPNESFVDLDYKIRNAIIDYFKKVDTINPVRDDRFIRKF